MVWADTQTYTIDTKNSRVVYTYETRGKPQSGVIPFKSGSVKVNLSDLSVFSGRAVLLADRAEVKPAMFAPALRVKSMLHTQAYPDMDFQARTPSQGSLTM